MTDSSRSRIVLSLAAVVGATLAARSASATSYTLDKATCEGVLGGQYSFGFEKSYVVAPQPPNTCKTSAFSLAASDVLSIPKGEELELDGTAKNQGNLEVESGAKVTLDQGGTLGGARFDVAAGADFSNFGSSTLLIRENGTFQSDGTISNEDSATIDNHGIFWTTGHLMNAPTGVIVNRVGAFLWNDGNFDASTGSELDNYGSFKHWSPSPTLGSCVNNPP